MLAAAEPPTIRLLVTARDPALRDGLAALLRRAPGLEIMAVVTPDAARSQAAATRVDAVVLDVAKPHADSVRVCRDLCALVPRPTVIALTTYADPEEERALRDAGAAAYLLKEVHLERLIHAVRQVIARERQSPGRSPSAYGETEEPQ
jgi:DNA-binding NarL/FixJ family response regulator